jgi:hypothetical protein
LISFDDDDILIPQAVSFVGTYTHDHGFSFSGGHDGRRPMEIFFSDLFDDWMHLE